MRSRLKYADAAQVVLGGGNWRRILDCAGIDSHDVGGIESLDDSISSDHLKWRSAARGWMLDGRSFVIRGGYDVTDECVLFGRLEVTRTLEQQLSLLSTEAASRLTPQTTKDPMRPTETT